MARAARWYQLGEPCPYMHSDGGCEFGDEVCAPGARDCVAVARWGADQGWGEDEDGGSAGEDERDAEGRLARNDQPDHWPG